MKDSTNSNIKRFLVAASVALAIPLSAAAFGGHHGGQHGGHDSCGPMSHKGIGFPMAEGGMLPPHLRPLNLTEGQQDKVFEIIHSQAPLMREKAKALRKAESDLRALSAAPEYSEAKARSLADATAKVMSEMTMARAKTERQIFEVLTPEQRKQLAELKPGGRGARSPVVEQSDS